MEKERTVKSGERDSWQHPETNLCRDILHHSLITSYKCMEFIINVTKPAEEAACSLSEEEANYNTGFTG